MMFYANKYKSLISCLVAFCFASHICFDVFADAVDRGNQMCMCESVESRTSRKNLDKNRNVGEFKDDVQALRDSSDTSYIDLVEGQDPELLKDLVVRLLKQAGIKSIRSFVMYNSLASRAFVPQCTQDVYGGLYFEKIPDGLSSRLMDLRKRLISEYNSIIDAHAICVYEALTKGATILYKKYSDKTSKLNNNSQEHNHNNNILEIIFTTDSEEECRSKNPDDLCRCVQFNVKVVDFYAGKIDISVEFFDVQRRQIIDGDYVINGGFSSSSRGLAGDVSAQRNSVNARSVRTSSNTRVSTRSSTELTIGGTSLSRYDGQSGSHRKRKRRTKVESVDQGTQISYVGVDSSMKANGFEHEKFYGAIRLIEEIMRILGVEIQGGLVGDQYIASIASGWLNIKDELSEYNDIQQDITKLSAMIQKISRNSSIVLNNKEFDCGEFHRLSEIIFTRVRKSKCIESSGKSKAKEQQYKEERKLRINSYDLKKMISVLCGSTNKLNNNALDNKNTLRDILLEAKCTLMSRRSKIIALCNQNKLKYDVLQLDSSLSSVLHGATGMNDNKKTSDDQSVELTHEQFVHLLETLKCSKYNVEYKYKETNNEATNNKETNNSKTYNIKSMKYDESKGTISVYVDDGNNEQTFDGIVFKNVKVSRKIGRVDMVVSTGVSDGSNREGSITITATRTQPKKQQKNKKNQTDGDKDRLVAKEESDKSHGGEVKERQVEQPDPGKEQNKVSDKDNKTEEQKNEEPKYVSCLNDRADRESDASFL